MGLNYACYRLIILLLVLLPFSWLLKCHRTVSYKYLPVQKSTSVLPLDDQLCRESKLSNMLTTAFEFLLHTTLTFEQAFVSEFE